MELCVCVCDAGGSTLQRLRSPEQQPDGELHIRQVCLYSVTMTLDIYVPTHRNQFISLSVNQFIEQLIS